MRLALLAPFDPRYWNLGGTIATLRLARALAERGHEVTFFAGHSHQESICVEGGLTLNYSTGHNRLPFYASFHADRCVAAAFKREHQHRPFAGILCRSGHLFHALKVPRRVARVFILDDVVMQELHALPKWTLRIRFWPQVATAAYFDRRAAYSADRIFVLMRSGVQDVEDAYPGCGIKTNVIPVGIDRPWFEGPILPLEDRLSPAVFMFQGTRGRSTRRDLNLFARALALLNSRGFPVQALLIRTDPQEAARVCGDLDVGYHVLNDIPEPDLIAAYDRALALVVPSYREGMCIPLVEAAARGTPSVASDLPQMREIVGDGPTGVLVPGYNPVNWADVMEKLLTGQEAWMRFSRAGTSSAETYSMARIAAKVDEILQEIVRNRGER